MSGMPERKRVAQGARRFNVAHNTFRSWCVDNKLPGRHSLLLDIVEDLLITIPGVDNTKSVVAWLICGDSVPDPFHGGAILESIEVFFQVTDRARNKGVAFDELPRDAKEIILRKTQDFISTNPDAVVETDNGIALNSAAILLVDSLLDMAETLSGER
ncbi:MAG: hypothetical protein AAF542_21900 [Pseudomonadota bacterium]